MKHLIVGDNHGFHHNLRKLLVQQEVINKKGAAINRDEYKVYCTGDLIDGEINRAGDILNLQLLDEWFDEVCIGNHEYAFLGGRDFGSKRKHDRETLRLLLQHLDSGKLVPSTVVKGHLLTHAGLSDEFDFQTAEDANEFIRAMWDAAPEHDGTIAIFDWKNNADYTGYTTADPTSGIFNLAWKKDRNQNFGQVVGHTIFTNGPIQQKQEIDGVVHYNIDVGAKEGKSIGGIIIDDDSDDIVSVFWGERKYDNKKQSETLINYPLQGDYSYEDLYMRNVSSRYGRPSEDFLGNTENSITPTNIKVGDRLVASWGEIFRITKIDRGMGDVTLKSEDSTKETSLIRALNSDWMVNFRRLIKIPVTGGSDIKSFNGSVLEDEEIMEFFRAERAAL